MVLTDAEKETVDKFEKQKMPIGAWVRPLLFAVCDFSFICVTAMHVS